MPGNHSSGVLLNGFTCILIVSGISKSERETGRKEGERRGDEARGEGWKETMYQKAEWKRGLRGDNPVFPRG